MNIGYIRVSTVEQNTARQLEGVELDRTHEDKCSGKDTNRPELNNMLNNLLNGDTVYVHDISRMAGNIADLLDLVETITAQGVTIRFHKKVLTFTSNKNDPMQKLMLTMLGAVYEFEKDMMLERQLEGVAIAKAAGKYKGRKPSVDREKVIELLKGGMSIRKLAAQVGVANSTIQLIKKEGQL
jgi:DNA invertase Pin-like site-specific DNA recombinase